MLFLTQSFSFFLSVAAELIDVISNNVIIVPGNLSNALCRQLCARLTEASWYEIAVQVKLTALVSRIPFWFESRPSGYFDMSMTTYMNITGLLFLITVPLALG